MNRLFYILLAIAITCPAAQALDIKTNASCKKLVTAITQAQDLRKCTAAWQMITASAAIATQDHKNVLAQALQLAQEQKAVLEQELANLGNKTNNNSKLTWGAAQLVVGAWFAAGEAILLYNLAYNKIQSKHRGLHDVPGVEYVYPELWLAYDKQIITEAPARICLGSRLFALNPIVAGFCFYKAYHNLKQGLNHKQFLQDKIANVDAIISYIQELQTNNQ